MKPTEEQQDIINSIKTKKSVKINAYAGSGKTTVLKMITETYPEKDFLYLAFNKSIAEEAKSKFPHNCEVRTIHSLAYQFATRHLGMDRKAFANKFGKFWKIKKYVEYLNIATRFPIEIKDSEAVHLIKQTLRNFKNSGAEEITYDHVPYKADKSSQYDASIIYEVMKCAKEVWQQEIDMKNEFPADHSTYLKLFSLHAKEVPQDIILFDECQDANGCMLDFIDKCSNQKVWIGDSHQAIYQFTGAINALEEIDSEETLYLTQSWRFGAAIAEKANELLRLTTENPKPIIGNPATQSEIGDVDKTKQYTILCRTNAGVAEAALMEMALGRKVFIENDVNEICSDLRGLRLLQMEQRPRSSKYAHFGNYKEVLKESKIDNGIRRDLKLVESLSNNFEESMRKLETEVLRPRQKRKADVIITTAHKAKGLEFDQVLLNTDFNFEINNVNREEINLMYVSVTRAIKKLEIPPAWTEFVNKLKELIENS